MIPRSVLSPFEEPAMRLLLCLVISVVVTAGRAAAEDKPTKPITPEEAARRVGKTCTVELDIKSTGKSKSGKVFFLNSSESFRNKDNVTIMLGEKAVKAYQEQKVEDLAAHFKGKTIRVTGEVKLYRDQPEIIVNDPKQVVIVEKK
jgi:DNA/RNA endonuclease YhcR with UshA esterase domain